MGTTNTTTGSNTSSLNFNPASQSIYNALIAGGSNTMLGYMNNPFNNPAYTMGAAQGQKGAKQLGANAMGALNQNQLAQGLGGQAGQGWLGAQRAQTGRANQSLSSQANIQNVLSAMQRQMAAAGTGLSFSPQLTGQTGNFSQTQQTSGLGTWLPQVMGAGLGALTGGMTGGLSTMMQAGGGGGFGGGFSGGNMFQSMYPGGAGSPFGGLTNSGGAPTNPFSMYMQQPQ